MKQTITAKQLNELSEKGKKKLRKWWKPTNRDIYFVHDEYEKEDGLNWNTSIFEGEDLSDRVAFPALSIGEMIEFLGDDTDRSGKTWGYYVLHGKHAYTKNLCDILWEAVKELLNE